MDVSSAAALLILSVYHTYTASEIKMDSIYSKHFFAIIIVYHLSVLVDIYTSSFVIDTKQIFF